MKLRINKLVAIALGLLSLAFFSGSAASAPGGCPAFTSAMVDAAWVAIDYSQTTPPIAGQIYDNPTGPLITCELTNDVGNTFYVYVGTNEAELSASGINIDDEPFSQTLLRTRVFDLKPADEYACRAAVLASFVWKNYCGPRIP